MKKSFYIKTGLTACLVAWLINAPASAQLTSPADEDNRKYEYFFLEATKLKATNDLSGAFELYRHALEINPDGPAALYEIAQLYLFLNQIPAALEAMEKAVANDSGNYWYAQGLAGLYQQRGMTDEAIALLEKIIVRFPEKHDALFGLLELYNRQQSYDKVIETLDLLEDRIGKSEQISMEKFRIYLTQQNHEKAFQEIESLVNEYPLDTRYQVILADVYLQNGREDEALQVLQKVLEADSDDPMATLSLASYYEKTGQTDKYEQQLDTLLLNTQIDADVKLNILRQLIFKAEQTKADSTEVISMFDRVIAQDTEDTQIPMLYAQYLLSKEMEEQSIPVLEHILNLDPANTAARMTLLGSAIRKNDFDWVIRITEPGVDVSPEVIEFYYYLGISYFQKEQYDKSLATFETALQNLPEGVNKEIVSDFYSMIGDIQHTKNKMPEAFAAYDSALVYNANNIGALNNYAYYLSIKQKPTEAELDKAEEMSHKTVKKEPTNSTYLDTYAWILFIKGNYAEAKLYIDDALNNGGDESDVIVEHAGDIYYMTGDSDGAVAQWKKSKDMGNESKTLKKKISRKKYISRMNKQKISNIFVWVFVISIIVCSCKSTKSGTGATGMIRVNSPESFTSRAKFTLVSGDKGQSMNGTVRMQLNVRIQISLLAPVLRTEAVRIEATPDEVLVIDRINKQYAVAPVSDMHLLIGSQMDYARLQDLLSEAVFLEGTSGWVMRQGGVDIVLPLGNGNGTEKLLLELSRIAVMTQDITPAQPSSRYTKKELPEVIEGIEQL